MTVKELKRILDNVSCEDEIKVKVFDNSTYVVDFIERGDGKLYIGIVEDLVNIQELPKKLMELK